MKGGLPNGNQIKNLRTQRGLTQETVAATLGVTSQAVSKWENDVALPDITLLPSISAYFGVTIDELFALTDEQRITRIRNMLYESREVEDAVLDREVAFLQDKARREPKNSEVRLILAWIENFKAQAHRRQAEYYAKESIQLDPHSRDAYAELADAVGVMCQDWYAYPHTDYIDWYQAFIAQHPDNWRAYLWLMDGLIQDRRYAEAEEWCDKLARINHTFRVPDYRARIAFAKGDGARALELWEQMVRDFPEDWMAWSSMGDGYVFLQQYERALDCYREARKWQTHPKAFVDPIQAMTQLYERMGDIPKAIEMDQEQLVNLREDWGITQGEEVDAVEREIQRLQKKLPAE